MTLTDGEGFRRQYWDTCLFINYLTNLEKDKADVVHDLLLQAERGKGASALTIVISNLVIAEVREKAGNVKERQEKLDRLFDTDWPYLEPHALTGTIAQRAREIGNRFPSITVPDAIHVATALHAKAEVLFTYDGAADRKERRRSGTLLKYNEQIGDPPLKIQIPWVYSGSMDVLKRQIEQAGGSNP
jgi:predicted nucleic acid-binding protein